MYKLHATPEGIVIENEANSFFPKVIGLGQPLRLCRPCRGRGRGAQGRAAGGGAEASPRLRCGHRKYGRRA